MPSASVEKNVWDARRYHGRDNRYPFTEVVSFVMRRFGGAADRSAVRILDLGCGSAHHLMFLAQEGFAYYGIDGSADSIALAARRLAAAGHRTQTLTTGTFDRLPYHDGFFDCVIDRGSLTCNRGAGLPALIAEVHRILKPGGRLFSMLLHEAGTARLEGQPLGGGDYANFSGRLEGAGVLHFTNASEAQSLFAAFQIDDIELIHRASEYPRSGNQSVVAWTVVTCRK